MRSPRFFDGLELDEPGLVRINRWRPDDVERAATGDTDVPFYGAVGRKA